MKVQIARFSPHQNAKVIGILMALASLVFFVPFFIIAAFIAPMDSGPPVLLILFLPILYLVLGYIMVVVSCAVYNVLYKYIGGFEFESRGEDA